MRTKIQKWGNSLSLRIPKAFAKDARIENDSLVDLFLVDGNIVVKPVPGHQVTLDQLLADVTADNMHHEIDTGGAAGNEAW
jgi:antitoxin MazE